MNRKRNRRLTRRAAELLLDQRAVDADDDLSRLLGAASAPARSRELAREESALALFHTARLETNATRSDTMLKSNLGRFAAAKAVLASVAAVTLASGGIALAATGNLPGRQGPADTRTSATAPATGSETSETEEPESDDPSAPTTGGTTQPTPSPSLTGLCRAFEAGNKSEHGKALESPAFAALISAAGGPDAVATYCVTLIGEPKAHPTHPVKPTHPTHSAQPTHPAHPTHPVKPTHPTHPVKPTHPTHPAQPTHPAHPAQPTKPAGRS